MIDFKNVKTLRALANNLGIPLKKLTYILYVQKPETYYSTFTIPKKNGEPRIINAPSGDLKKLQKKISISLYKYRSQLAEKNGVDLKIAHAFEKDKTILTNARIHRNKRYLLNLDLKDYFDSFHFGRVKGYFQKNHDFELPDEVATALANIVCYKGKLPQGAPSSPVITNMIANNLDMRLLYLVRKYHLDYTRYADDLTFSTNDKKFLDDYDSFLEAAEKIINKSGFEINSEKTRLQYNNSRQSVTGVIVNKKLNIDRRYYKETRAIAHTLYKTGSMQINGKDASLNMLEGRFAFINMFDSYNNELNKKSQKNNTRNGRELEYKKFLIYKYFFANKPCIITEGKTDIPYLKAALKKYWSDYPELIQKNDDGTFNFKISFFKRNKKKCYILGMGEDGADAMKNIYNLYTNKHIDYFCELSGTSPKNPVILLFDNELNEKKPLKIFVSYAKIKKENQIAKLKDGKFIHLNSNLYITTNPLVKNMTECEIEDLLPDSVLNMTIDGRKFDRTGKENKKDFFSKDELSKLIYSEYDKYDLSNLKCLLDNFRDIMNEYEESFSEPNS